MPTQHRNLRARVALPLLLLSLSACAEEASPRPPRRDVVVRAKHLTIQRRADGIEEIDLTGLRQHATVVATGADGGVTRACEGPVEAEAEP